MAQQHLNDENATNPKEGEEMRKLYVIAMIAAVPAAVWAAPLVGAWSWVRK